MAGRYVIRYETSELCPEGPWDSAEEAQRFLDAEVGVAATVYEVVTCENPADLDKRDLPNVAAYMRDAGIAAQMVLRRPKGRTLYHVHLFENGRTTRPMSVGATLRQNAKV
jgi:hypothetical protein